MDDFGGNSCAYKMEHISGVAFIYRSNNITWKTWPLVLVLFIIVICRAQLSLVGIGLTKTWSQALVDGSGWAGLGWAWA